MKKVVFALLVSLYYQAIAQPQLQFSDAKQNFGFVKKGEQVKLNYKFTNNGNQPLAITDVKVECSCTKVIWPKTPILPGKSEVIEVLFDTTPTYDRQDRIVEIFS